MKRTPLQRRTPLAPGKPPARTTPPQQTTELRRAPIRRRPRRQPGKSPFPMTCPPGFWHHMMRNAGYQCQRCPSKRHLTLSHVLAAGKGGPFTDWNIYVLCAECHDHCERHPEQAERERWRVRGEIRRGHYTGPAWWYKRLVDQAREDAA